MPIYEYECPVHGPFDEIRRVAERNEPMACGECGVLCKRNEISAPPHTTLLTEELRGVYGDAVDAITLPWEKTPVINSLGDVQAHFKKKGVSMDAIVPNKEWRDRTGRPSHKERTGIELDRRPILGRR